MNSSMIIEGIGYLGSILVVVSMLMTSVKKLRIVNTTGSLIFTVYALIIHSYPTAFMNLCLIIINIFQLAKLIRQEQNFSLIRGRSDIGATPFIIKHYLDDIKKFFPYVNTEDLSKHDTVYIVAYETTPAGVLVGDMSDGDTLNIWLDYATPVYRDSSVGSFLYQHLPQEGIRRLVMSEKTSGHEEYMLKMGFIKTDKGYEKEL